MKDLMGEYGSEAIFFYVGKRRMNGFNESQREVITKTNSPCPVSHSVQMGRHVKAPHSAQEPFAFCKTQRSVARVPPCECACLSPMQDEPLRPGATGLGQWNQWAAAWSPGTC